MTQFTIRGHDLLAVERFRDDTRHMIEFEVLKDDNLSIIIIERRFQHLLQSGYSHGLGFNKHEISPTFSSIIALLQTRIDFSVL